MRGNLGGGEEEVGNDLPPAMPVPLCLARRRLFGGDILTRFCGAVMQSYGLRIMASFSAL